VIAAVVLSVLLHAAAVAIVEIDLHRVPAEVAQVGSENSISAPAD
jgi:hypothetical protein